MSSFCNLPLLFLLSLLPLLPPLPQHISGVTLWNVNNSRCWHRLVVHIVKKSCAETIELLMYNNDSCIKEMKLLTKPWFCAFTSSRKDRFIHPSRRVHVSFTRTSSYPHAGKEWAALLLLEKRLHVKAMLRSEADSRPGCSSVNHVYINALLLICCGFYSDGSITATPAADGLHNLKKKTFYSPKKNRTTDVMFSVSRSLYLL